jgi:hypothetical protein
LNSKLFRDKTKQELSFQIGLKSKFKTTNRSSKQFSITNVIINHSSTFELKQMGPRHGSSKVWSIEGTVNKFFWSHFIKICNPMYYFYLLLSRVYLWTIERWMCPLTHEILTTSGWEKTTKKKDRRPHWKKRCKKT